MTVKTVNVDRRRSTKNAVCIGLALVLVAVLFRAFGSTPSGASASPVGNNAPAPSAVGNPSITPARPIVIEIPDALPRDLFDASTAFPPEVAAVKPATAPATVAVKSPTAADERAAIAAEARNTIILDATILGANPTALINGRRCRVGNVVKGFTVRQIAADHVVIERGGVRLKVSYANAGNAKD
jgi:hypothetical protein